MKPNIILTQMELGPLQNFIYFLGDPESKEVALIDPAWDVDYLRNTAKKQGWKITKVLLTHGHPDHVNGLDDILSTHDIPIFISAHEADFYTPRCKNLNKVKPNEIITIGNLKVNCLHTPGHSPGCQCFLIGNTLISGDTLFIDGCGRCDLPGSDVKAMYRSLYEVIMKLPDAAIAYPGHNYGPTPSATIGDQKKTNPYLTCKNMEEFLLERMGMVF